MSTNNTLYVVGDSFSYHFRCEEYSKNIHAQNAPLWHRRIASMLGVQYLKNYSVAGVSQDYIFQQLDKEVFPNITQDDYLIIVPTDRSRFWFFQDDPGLSNFSSVAGTGSIGIKKYIQEEEKQNSVLGFISHIQREELDTLWNTWRFGWLSYKVKNLRPPLILQGFDNDNLSEVWENLNFSKGSLSKVQQKECNEGDPFVWWKGKDLRYNHLCISNHIILADKIYDFFVNDNVVDLNIGFCKNILKKYTWNSAEFTMKELNIQEVDNYNANNTR